MLQEDTEMPMNRPTKYAEEPAPLLCPVCKNVFEEPIISVKCGHTFCRKCIENLVTAGNMCPLDGQACDSGQLVLNLAIMGQLADLKIYCCHGLVPLDPSPTHLQSDGGNVGEKYKSDPEGCQEKICISQRAEHEDSCEFAWTECPIGGKACGPMRKKGLQGHMEVCSNIPCSYADFGEEGIIVLCCVVTNQIGQKTMFWAGRVFLFIGSYCSLCDCL